MAFKDEEFITNEIPNQSSYASKRRADNAPLIIIKTKDRLDAVEYIGSHTHIDKETNHTNHEEPNEFQRSSFVYISGKRPIFIPKITINISHNERYALVENIKS